VWWRLETLKDSYRRLKTSSLAIAEALRPFTPGMETGKERSRAGMGTEATREEEHSD